LKERGREGYLAKEHREILMWNILIAELSMLYNIFSDKLNGIFCFTKFEVISGREVDHSPPTSAEVKKMWTHTTKCLVVELGHPVPLGWGEWDSVMNHAKFGTENVCDGEDHQ
jgi:hypothetical protein